MPEISPETVPGAVQVPLWLLALLFVSIVLLAGWAIRRKDARDAAREERANAMEDQFLAAREKWTEALLKMAIAQEKTGDRLERVEAGVIRLEALVLNGHRKVGA